MKVNEVIYFKCPCGEAGYLARHAAIRRVSDRGFHQYQASGHIPFEMPLQAMFKTEKDARACIRSFWNVSRLIVDNK
jgi:hypothetical protein